MGLKTTNKQIIQEVPWGMMVWRCPDGEFLGDDQGNFLHVFCTNTDRRLLEAAKKAITEAAASYGFTEGKAVFWPGVRPIDDEELERQKARAAAGLVPDPLDIAAIREEERMLHQRND